MTRPGFAPGLPNPYSVEQVTAELRDPSALLNPNPDTYRAAAAILQGYFGERSYQAPTEVDTNFEGVVDETITVLCGFYGRDEQTGQVTNLSRFGGHQSDHALKSALHATVAVEQIVVGAGRAPIDDRDTISLLTELGRADGEVPMDPTMRTFRHRAAEAVRRATRSAREMPEAYAQVAEVGFYAAQAIDGLADIAARHPRDTRLVGVADEEGRFTRRVPGELSQLKDYLQRHTLSALEGTQA